MQGFSYFIVQLKKKKKAATTNPKTTTQGKKRKRLGIVSALPKWEPPNLTQPMSLELADSLKLKDVGHLPSGPNTMQSLEMVNDNIYHWIPQISAEAEEW